jgi:hypothetical protein
MTEKENQSQLLSLFGGTARRKVILATTRWDTRMDEGIRANRQQELSNDWETVCRLDDSAESAWNLVETLLSKYASGIVPQLLIQVDTARHRPSSESTISIQSLWAGQLSQFGMRRTQWAGRSSSLASRKISFVSISRNLGGAARVGRCQRNTLRWATLCTSGSISC